MCQHLFADAFLGFTRPRLHSVKSEMQDLTLHFSDPALLVHYQGLYQTCT
jgi:hypothetical protein